MNLSLRNRSDSALKLCLEPEGHCIEIPPRALCEVSLAEDIGSALEVLELEWDPGTLTLHAMVDKAAAVNGIKVR
jgi:hypothetical protein